MFKKNNQITGIRHYGAADLIKKFGSPLYIYDEATLRNRCKKIKAISDLTGFNIYYSVKANSSIALLKIILSEGLNADFMSLGELYLVQKAGFKNNQLLFMSNNIKKEDFLKIIPQNIKICLDSLDQLELFFSLPGSKNAFIRINNSITDGHSEKVKTAGAVKFGITPDQIPEAFRIAKKFDRQISGFFSHIGSGFLDYNEFQANVLSMLEMASAYPSIKYIDFGGGFGIPYHKEKQLEFDVETYSKIFNSSLKNWLEKESNRRVNFSIQPGRFVVAECGICLCSVKSIKENYGRKFVGTDLGFNFFPRPVMYDSYHSVRNLSRDSKTNIRVDITGNVCESGDIQAKNIELDSKTTIGDILAFEDAGAYCFSMSSNYIAMPRPAEILIGSDENVHLIRKQEPLEVLDQYQVDYNVQN